MSNKRKGDLNPMYGKSIKDYMSEENFDEWRKKQSYSHKGKKFSEEHKQKIRESLLRYYESKKQN